MDGGESTKLEPERLQGSGARLRLREAARTRLGLPTTPLNNHTTKSRDYLEGNPPRLPCNEVCKRRRTDPKTRPPPTSFKRGILALIAEFETDIRRERQKDGIAKAQERGVRFGRKPLFVTDSVREIGKLRKVGRTVPEIMRQTNLSKASVYRALG